MLLRRMEEWSNIGKRVVSYTLHPFTPENEPLAPAEWKGWAGSSAGVGGLPGTQPRFLGLLASS
jgi:hypothetical protein